MNKRKIIAVSLILIAIVLGGIFLREINFAISLKTYLDRNYYKQFGPLAIAIELLIAGIYLFIKHPKTNLVLAVFGFSALLDPLFNLTGLFTSLVPFYATVIFVICAGIALWLSFTDSLKLSRISMLGALLSFLFGAAVELFFNYI